jgi:hypothetical protein
MATKEELKAKRRQAMGVVGAQMDASAAMYDEVIAYGAKVEEARGQARAAHLNAMDAEISDLKEMRDEMAEFTQAAPPTSQAGTASGVLPTVKPRPGPQLSPLCRQPSLTPRGGTTATLTTARKASFRRSKRMKSATWRRYSNLSYHVGVMVGHAVFVRVVIDRRIP